MSNIGLCTFWGWARGMAYGNLGYAKMLTPEHNVFIFKLGKNEIEEEFKVVDVKVTENPSFHIDPKLFSAWIKDNKIDAVIFNEYNQWGDDNQNIPKLAKSLGCKVYGDLVMERFVKGQEENYDRVFAQTVSMERYYRINKVRNFTYIPRSVDLDEFPKRKYGQNEKFTFFHPAGFGGVANRKNTDKVLKAFSLLNRDDTKLIITSQKGITVKNLPENVELIDKDLSRKELIDIYYKSDVVLIPSKWETVGLPILEALASGIPVITNDVPPMNEFIRPGKNGYLCSVELKHYENISVLGAEVDAKELKVKMENILNPSLYSLLANNSRRIAELIYDIKKTKKYLLDFLKEDLK